MTQEFTVATWNVNSIRTRLQAVLDWLAVCRPQILCVQETKVQDEHFPKAPFSEAGYDSVFTGQKGYNGVALFSSVPLRDVATDFKGNPDGSQCRFISARAGGIPVVNVYIPNGGEVGSSRFDYKLNFILKLRDFLDQTYSPRSPLVLAGDFNVAPHPIDVYDPVALEGQILFHPREREALKQLEKWGLVDLFRIHHGEGGQYSWWDYRLNSFKRNMGLRIDHVWSTASLAAGCTSCEIDPKPRKWVRPSDHAPVIARFKI